MADLPPPRAPDPTPPKKKETVYAALFLIVLVIGMGLLFDWKRTTTAFTIAFMVVCNLASFNEWNASGRDWFYYGPWFYLSLVSNIGGLWFLGWLWK